MTILKKRRGKDPQSKEAHRYRFKVEYGWMRNPPKRKIVVVKKTKRGQRAKVVAKKERRPSSYVTMPHYFPTEQVDIVRKMRPKRRKRRK